MFVVAYQNILKLTYIDKFLTEIQLRFRDKYKQAVQTGQFDHDFSGFRVDFDSILSECEQEARLALQAEKKPRSYEQSEKANKTVASMIETKKGGLLSSFIPAAITGETKQETSTTKPANVVAPPSPETLSASSSPIDTSPTASPNNKMKSMGGKPKKFEPKKKTPASPQQPVKKGKVGTKWEPDVSGPLDYGGKPEDNLNGSIDQNDLEKYASKSDVGKGKDLKAIEVVDAPAFEEDEEIIEEKPVKKGTNSLSSTKTNGTTKPAASSSGGIFSSLKSLVGSKILSKEMIEPVMEKLQEHLVAKNVAAEIAQKVCSNVATNLEGKQLGSFQFVATTVKQALQESMVQILTPKKRVDILRDVYESQRQKKPYVIVFCGVNGVGKSTNLAKITFWLIENNFRVLIAACDTFRSGAVEQLRTHTRHLNALHPPENHNGKTMVELFEKGYGKDAAAIAHDAIGYAKDNRIDVVLVDTAGRMQDNEPLMKALAKLINFNNPDLVLFVGEALVGNEAVDQVKKFNQALVDNSTTLSSSVDQARTIDGIILTKFDTIDDKVGAAISMTYTTGQPIVFVGTGQTYSDLKSLNAQSVVQSLLK